MGTIAEFHRYICSCGRVGAEHAFRMAAENMHRAHANAARAKEAEEAAADRVIA